MNSTGTDSFQGVWTRTPPQCAQRLPSLTYRWVMLAKNTIAMRSNFHILVKDHVDFELGQTVDYTWEVSSFKPNLGMLTSGQTTMVQICVTWNWLIYVFSVHPAGCAGSNLDWGNSVQAHSLVTSHALCIKFMLDSIIFHLVTWSSKWTAFKSQNFNQGRHFGGRVHFPLIFVKKTFLRKIVINLIFQAFSP